VIKVIPLLVYQVKKYDIQQLKESTRDAVDTVTQKDFNTFGQGLNIVYLLVVPPRVPTLVSTRVGTNKNT
jgi:hypothetical protein